MSQQFNILLSSAGRRVALFRILRHTLTDLGLQGQVMATDASRLSAAFHTADRSFVVPRCTEGEFIPTLLRICQQHEIRLIVPTIDTELPMYAANRQRFAEIGTTVLVSTPDVIHIGGDKQRTHAWLSEHEFPTVRQASVADVLARPSEWSWPLLVKPVGGSASIGVAVVRTQEELASATLDGYFVVQSIARGVEHTIDFLADRQGRCVCSVPRRRLETRGGEVSKGMTFKSRLLQDLAARLCQALPGAYGTLNVQVFLDLETEEMSIIEINPRFGGGYPLAWEAGAHFPRWIIEDILGYHSTAARDRWRDRLVMLRYDDAVFVDAAAAGVR